MKLQRRIDTSRPFTEEETIDLAEKLALATAFIVAAKMVIAPHMKDMARLWKMRYEALWKQCERCSEMLEQLPEEDDDHLHETSAAAVTGALNALEEFKAEKRLTQMPQ